MGHGTLIGSSPHTRGTSSLAAVLPAGERFIPAHTGNIPRPRAGSWTRAVHPRTHGEHRLNLTILVNNSGSSPHTRGTFSEVRGHAKRARFIPAHTGNIHVPMTPNAAATVHPRTHGEHRCCRVSVLL